jgi:hypothetical protein
MESGVRDSSAETPHSGVATAQPVYEAEDSARQTQSGGCAAFGSIGFGTEAAAHGTSGGRCLEGERRSTSEHAFGSGARRDAVVPRVGCCCARGVPQQAARSRGVAGGNSYGRSLSARGTYDSLWPVARSSLRGAHAHHPRPLHPAP